MVDAWKEWLSASGPVTASDASVNAALSGGYNNPNNLCYCNTGLFMLAAVPRLSDILASAIPDDRWGGLHITGKTQVAIDVTVGGMYPGKLADCTRALRALILLMRHRATADRAVALAMAQAHAVLCSVVGGPSRTRSAAPLIIMEHALTARNDANLFMQQLLHFVRDMLSCAGRFPLLRDGDELSLGIVRKCTTTRSVCKECYEEQHCSSNDDTFEVCTAVHVRACAGAHAPVSATCAAHRLSDVIKADLLTDTTDRARDCRNAACIEKVSAQTTYSLTVGASVLLNIVNDSGCRPLLDRSLSFSDNKSAPHSHHLTAVSIFLGSHYITHRRYKRDDSSDLWVQYDDARVSVITETEGWSSRAWSADTQYATTVLYTREILNWVGPLPTVTSTVGDAPRSVARRR
jgi:hypothetical protein